MTPQTLTTRSGRRLMSVERARSIFSQTVQAARLGTLDAQGVRNALTTLAAIRSDLRGAEQRQVALYERALEEEWVDAAAAVPSPHAGPLLQQAQQVVVDAFERQGDRLLRLALARSALDHIGQLSHVTSDLAERAAIVRLAEPLLLMIAKLQDEQPASAAR